MSNKFKPITLSLLLLLLLAACASGPTAPPEPAPVEDATQAPQPDAGEPAEEEESAQQSAAPASIAQAGDSFITYVPSEGIGDIAVQVALPEQPRYAQGAGIVVEVGTYLTPNPQFFASVDANAIGLIHISYLWPGISAPNGAQSAGSFDYGGPDAIRALGDVIAFAAGELPNREGFYLADLIAITPLSDNLGLYAFSHPGQAAVNVMALHGEEFSKLAYFVGRENPTLDKLTAVEVGHFDSQNRPVLNPLYSYPVDYDPRQIHIDYSSIAWAADYSESGSNWTGLPYFDLNGNGSLDGSDFLLGSRIPAAFGKRLYSTELLAALQANGALNDATWPSDLASPEEAARIWAFQDSPPRYPTIGQKLPDLKVMLVFARFDHVQPAPDKPHIHQAYEGFHFGADLWVRLNPDLAYIAGLDADFGAAYSEHAANQEPADWLDAEDWGYPNRAGASQLAPLAALAEMADRTMDGNWNDDLSAVLYSTP